MGRQVRVAPAPSEKDAPERVKAHGIVKKRRCRDLFWLLLFIIMWAAYVYVAYIAWMRGNVNRLQYGTDMYGNLCGFDNRLTNNSIHQINAVDKPNLYWPKPGLDLTTQICVSSCPVHSFSLANFTVDKKISWGNFSISVNNFICDYGLLPTAASILAGDCWPQIASVPLLNRCIPVFDDASASKVMEAVNAEDFLLKFLGDLQTVWLNFLICAAVAMALGWVWLLLMWLLVGPIVWFTIVFVIVVIGALSLYCALLGWQQLQTLVELPAEFQLQIALANAEAARIAACVIGAIDVILMLVIIAMRKRIKIAIQVIREAGKAMSSMPSITLFPFFTFIGVAVSTAWGLGVIGFLITIGDAVYDTNHKFAGYERPPEINYMLVFALFAYFWSTEMVMAIGQATIAGAVASWYWVLERKDRPTFPVAAALWRVLFYSLGSLAFGSLILAVVRLARAVLGWLQKRLSGTHNPFLMWVLRCLSCCLKCFERFMRFLNRNAYIMIAINGTSFCVSARRAFELILKNVLRIGTLSVISSFVLFLGKLFIVACTTTLAVFLMKGSSGLNFWVLPVVMVAIITYLIASVFMGTYDMTIDTIMLSFCEDIEVNEGTAERPYYMPAGLLKIIDGDHRTKGGCCGPCC